MTKQHPITPPPELWGQWLEQWNNMPVPRPVCLEWMATQAARWGADQELDACCEWLKSVGLHTYALRAARRPKPPTLKEQAKFAAAVLRSPDETCSIAELQQHWHTICNALEALPND
jgi:hypothetical protein